MKARIFLIIAVVTLIFASCKKEVTDKLAIPEIKIAEIAKQEVINYVQSKRVKGDKDLNGSIDTILSQINWSNYKIVYTEAGHKLTVIELSSFSENKLMMLLYTNKGKTGYNGLHLVTAKKQPTSKISEMDAIALIHQGKEHTFTGAISYFNITKKFIYDVGYENGIRKYFRTLGDKKNPVSGEATTEACYEVYLITYWSDGSTTYDYMYSFCDTGGGGGDCHQQRLLNFNTASAANGLRCGPWSGGGGTPPSGQTELSFESPEEAAAFQLWLNDLSPAELALCFENPVAALQIYRNSKIALNAFPDWNGIGDSKRHAFWMALNAKDPLVGSIFAARFGIAHETGGMPSTLIGKPFGHQQWQLEIQSDLHNNNEGIRIISLMVAAGVDLIEFNILYWLNTYTTPAGALTYVCDPTPNDPGSGDEVLRFSNQTCP